LANAIKKSITVAPEKYLTPLVEGLSPGFVMLGANVIGCATLYLDLIRCTIRLLDAERHL
jgi:hypothetical protein